MKFGLTVFATTASLAVADLARTVEALGFDTLWFPDHTHVPVNGSSAWPGGGDMPHYYRATFDPLIACTVAASATERLRVGVGVCLVPARDPIVLAKQVASIDVMSSGRMVLGVGAGWNRAEIANHGVDPSQRWDVMRERVLAMKEIWSHDEASFQGHHVSFPPLWSWPKPLQQPGVPIVVGGHGPGVVGRVLDYGDEWLVMPSSGAPPLGERLAELGRRADELGRPRPRVSVQVYGLPPEDRIIERYVALGVDRIDLAINHGDPSQQHRELDELAETVTRWATAERAGSRS
jgi:probable F420-dependent oxidoreductase